MLDQEDLKWIAATSTDLNSVLQQVSRYADLARRHRGEHNYVDLLAERVELASKTAQSLFDRVTSKILSGAAKKSAAARRSEAGFTVMPPPTFEPVDTGRRARRSEQKVESKTDKQEALKIYEQMGKKVGLVILDYFLPVIDGDAVFDELRAVNPNVNVVLSSGFAEQTKIASMLSQGLRGFIPKPYSRAKLLEQVRSTLEAARQPQR